MSKRIVLYIIFVLAFSLSLSTNALAIADKDVYFGGKAKEGKSQNATITVSGTLSELPKTSLPVTITISSGGKTFLAEITSKTKIVRKYDGKSKLTEFALGDNVEVSGTIASSGNIKAKKLKNNSISATSTAGIYGDIISINKAGNSFVLRWKGKKNSITVNSDTKFIIPGKKTNGKLADLKVGDRIQGRGVYNRRTDTYLADIGVVVRRSAVSLIKKYSKSVNKEGVLSKINSTKAPTTIEFTSGSATFSVNITSKTVLVRKNFGKSSLSEFQVGDKIHVVGTLVGASTTKIAAKMIKDDNLTTLKDAKVDDDQDGIADVRDTKPNDHDNDGIKDSKDTDDDNDGILDASDANPFDFDNDGINDKADTDDDNDGIADTSDTKPYDHDNDGVNNAADTDDDNDGIADTSDTMPYDHDNDGIMNATDTDDDNDGIADTSDTKPYDYDNDGINNADDPDDDNDGIADSSDARLFDHDNDGISDLQDTDDDNDGIADTSDTKPYDHDNDGINNAADTDDDNDGIADTSDTMPYDHDNDGFDDVQDTDDDNDGIADTLDTKPYDYDNDGVHDGIDTDDDNDDVDDVNDEYPFNRWNW